jgi:hypothetical protein
VPTEPIVHPGSCRNLIDGAQVEEEERALVVVDMIFSLPQLEADGEPVELP